MKLKRYCVTVMDNWTAAREFWTYAAARRFAEKHYPASNLYLWNDDLAVWVRQ